MSFYEGIDFFAVLCVALLPAIYLGIREKRKEIYINIISIFFVIMVFKEKPLQFIYLIVFVIAEIALLQLYQKYLAKGYAKK